MVQDNTILEYLTARISSGSPTLLFFLFDTQEAKDNCSAIMTAVKPARSCSSGLQVLLFVLGIHEVNQHHVI